MTVDMLIATALTEEHQVVIAVLDHLATFVGESPSHVRMYTYGTGNGRVYQIAAASAHQLGAVKMGLFAATMFSEFSPARAALVGIAAAVETKAVALGDVPFSSHVLSYDDIAMQDGVLTFRTEGYPADPTMRRAAGALRTSTSTYVPWREACTAIVPMVVEALNRLRRGTITPPESVEPPHFVVEITAGGPFLLRDADFRDALRDGQNKCEIPKVNKIEVAFPLHPKLVSVEMESHGFMNAALEHGVPACVLKGISDVGDRKKQALEKKTGGFFRAYACSNAVLATLHLLHRAQPNPGQTARANIYEVPETISAKKLEVEVERLLSEAWDMMGGEAGTETVIAGRASNATLELARRLIQDQALRLNTNHPKGHLYLGVYYILSGRKTKAIQSIKTAITLDPDSPRTRAALGFALMDSDPSAALSEYVAALALDPHYATAHRGKASALTAMEKHEAALTALRAGVALAPSSAMLAHELAVGLASRWERPADALQYFEQAVGLEPENALYHSHKSRILRMLGRHDEADAAAIDAERLDPNCTHALVEMGATLLHQGHVEGAIEHYEKAIRLDPNHATPYLSLAAIYFSHYNEPMVVEMFRRAIRRTPIRAEIDKHVSNTFIGAAATRAHQLLVVAWERERV
jgi:tetratricopeptide (TPR) repeat protein/nucleoside phosphorylase